MYKDIYEEPLTIVIPAQLRKDKRLKFIDRSVWALIAKFYGLNEDMSNRRIAEELDIGFEYLRTIKSKLASFGYLTKHRDRSGVFRYLPIEPAMVTADLLDQFLSVSKLFKDITLLQFRSVLKTTGKSRADLLKAMSALEATYENKVGKVKDPIALLIKALKTGPTFPVGRDPDWWKERLQVEKAKKDMKQAEDADRQAIEKEAVRAQTLDDHFNSLPVKERKALKKRATKILEAKGGLSDFGREILIQQQVRKILEEEGGVQVNDDEGQLYATVRDEYPPPET